MKFEKKNFWIIVVTIISVSLTTISSCLNREASGASVESTESDEAEILMATKTRPLTDIKFSSTPERLKRGEYLANGILECFLCHSTRDSSKVGFPPIESTKGGGSILYESEKMRVVAPNISPDIETGAGSWTDDMFARAIREGIGHDGRALSLPMYWESFSELSDEDLASIVVYLRSIPPVKNKLPKRKFSLEREKELQGSSWPLLQPVKEQDLSDMIARGKYFIKTADCIGCHTSWYKRNPGFFGGGNKLSMKNDTQVVFSTNITPDATGLKGWTPEMFINVIRTGKMGVLNPRMPWIAYKNISDEDLKAIFAALQQLPEVNHKVINGIEPTYCEVCEQEHGYGKYNKIVPLKAVPFDHSLYPEFVGTYMSEDSLSISVKLDKDKLLISKEGRDFEELVPISEKQFRALGLPAPVSFKRNNFGKVKWLVSFGIEEYLFEKVENDKVSKAK